MGNTPKSLRPWAAAPTGLKGCCFGWLMLLAGCCQAMAATGESPESAAELLARGAQPLMMAGQNHAVPAARPAHLAANPLDGTIQQSRSTIAQEAASSVSTGMSSKDYIALVRGIVQYFGRFQAANGRILDPFLHREYQYSTPAYALAAAALPDIASSSDLLDSASRALESSLYQLASGTATDRHGDFFILPAILAYQHLRDRVDPATRSRWDRYLQMIDPKIAYSDLIGPGQADVINWNTAAIAGEFLRYRNGFGGREFVERYLDAQVPRFTPAGVYRDPGVPLAYDASARFNLLMVLESGYSGRHQKALQVLLERGAWTSLLMQSPLGDSPAGGRSAEHVWSDALACASFELWAKRSKAQGDMVAARAFKRAAHLAARSVAKWVRPSGELWIVKNHFDPALRRGFEAYSSHSQYNLLAAAYLAIAASASDETIAEGASPADVGGFVMHLPEFGKIFANSAGHYVEIETAADPHYNSTGLLRVHRKGLDAFLGPPNNAPAATVPLTLGISWPDGAGGWQSLAQIPADKLRASVSVTATAPDRIEFSVRYEIADAATRTVTESYQLSADSLVVSILLEGSQDRWRLTFPAFVTDGKHRGDTRVANDAVMVKSGASAQSLRLLSPHDGKLERTGRIVEMRNGDYEVIELSGPGRQVSYRLGIPEPLSEKSSTR